MESRDILIEKVENILSESNIFLNDKDFWLKFLYSASDKQILIFVNVFEKKPELLSLANNLFKEKFKDFGDAEKMKNVLNLESSFLAEMLDEIEKSDIEIKS